MASKEAEKKADGDAPLPPAPVSWHRQLLSMKDTLIIVLTPFIFLPIIIMYDSKVCIGTNDELTRSVLLLFFFGKGVLNTWCWKHPFSVLKNDSKYR